MEQRNFLLTTAARPIDRRVALAAFAAFAASCVIFVAAAPFAGIKLPAVWAFVPSYQSALAINDLITAVLLYAQFPSIRSRALLILASGYLFTALMAVMHALSFPGLFAPSGLLGAGPQTTAWLYMFWHGGFPLTVIAYALVKNRDGVAGTARRSARVLIATSATAALAVGAGFTLLATVGQDALPAIMQGNGHTSAYAGVVWSTWALSLVALVVLGWRRPYSVLDLWLMVVVVVWLFDVALAAVFSQGRFDIGFYVGRIYGLVAASVVLMALLIETGALYARLARFYEADRRRAADKIFSINARLETLVDSSPLPVFSLDARGRVATWNTAAERIFGRPAAEMVGQDFAALPGNAGNEFAAAHRRVMAGERLQDLQMRWTRHDGRALDVVHCGAPVREAGERVAGAVYISEDVTDKHKLQRQLAQAQKMEAVGQLTGGVAHDFNNILTVITGTIEILAEGVADRPALADITKLIDEAATRGAGLTRQLLAFARKQPLQPQETDINGLMVGAAHLLRPTLGEQIEIESMLEDEAWPALIDRDQLVTAVINLAINARDAMSGGGKLTLETGNVVLDEAYASLNPDARPGPYVMIAVSDTGSGIPAALRDKVFEPFFTTKEVGKGTGLGLSMVYGFVKQSGGHIKIYSEEGHGTSIKLYLPRASGDALPQVEAPSLPQVNGNESILVVEDDRMVREYVVTQLASLGYSTIPAADAAEALALLDGGTVPDLLFTDVIMPGGINGRSLAEQACRRRPGLRVLFTSGYTETAIVHHGRLDPGVLLLPKPYRKVDLARMIRKALDAPPNMLPNAPTKLAPADQVA
jgi:PAS domain S-box-containing protein